MKKRRLTTPIPDAQNRLRYVLCMILTSSALFKAWLEEPLSNFERPPILKFADETAVNYGFNKKFADFERPLDNFERLFWFLKTA